MSRVFVPNQECSELQCNRWIPGVFSDFCHAKKKMKKKRKAKKAADGSRLCMRYASAWYLHGVYIWLFVFISILDIRFREFFSPEICFVV